MPSFYIDLEWDLVVPVSIFWYCIMLDNSNSYNSSSKKTWSVTNQKVKSIWKKLKICM